MGRLAARLWGIKIGLMRLGMICAVGMLVRSADAWAQELAPELVISNAAVVLKLALPIEASRLSIVSPDTAIWAGAEGELVAAVERNGTCSFEIKKPGAPGLRIDFTRLSVPIQHACGTRSCGIRLSGIERAVCVTASGEKKEQCKGFTSLGPLPPEAARGLLARIALIHRTPGCEPLRPGAPKPRA